MDIQFDVTKVTLETPRLLLRAFREEDAADFYAYASVPGVGEMAGSNHHESMKDTHRVLGMFPEEKTFWNTA